MLRANLMLPVINTLAAPITYKIAVASSAVSGRDSFSFIKKPIKIKNWMLVTTLQSLMNLIWRAGPTSKYKAMRKSIFESCGSTAEGTH